MKINTTEKEISFVFPRFQSRYNPYMDDEDQHLLGKYPTFTGLIIRHRKNGNNWDEIGFAGTIDMDYKGKGDQFSDIIVAWDGSEESFKEKCDELNIGWTVILT